MAKTVIEINNLGKQYRLGSVGTGTMSDDLKRFMYRVRGKEDPFLKVGETNDRSKKGTSDYTWALKDISFKVEQGEVLGIIGKNGAGKSTLLKILSRTTLPTVGEYKVRGRIASLLEVGTGFHPDLSGRENIFLNGAILGMRRSEIQKQFDAIVDFSGVERYIDTPVKRYSSGMYVRLAFAVAAHLEPEILIVDEVLAVGDAEFQKKCLGKMKDVSGQGRTILFVSHNMTAINSLCNKGILLINGTLDFAGGITEVVSKYLNTGVEGLVSQAVFPPDEKKIFQVLQVDLLDQDNKSVVSCLDVRDKFRLKIKYIFRQALSSVNLTLYFTNSQGEVVYFLDRTDYTNIYFSADPGVFESLLEFDLPLLVPGIYTVTAGLGDNYSNENDHKFDVLRFEIDATSAFRTNREGFIFRPVAWEMKKI